MRLKEPLVPIEPFTCNLVSLVERVIAWAITGSPRVLSRKLMDYLWMTLGIMETGYPSLHECLKIDYDKGLLSTGSLPLLEDPRTGQPISSVDASILYTYGQDVLDVRRTPFHVPTDPLLTFMLSTTTPSRL